MKNAEEEQQTLLSLRCKRCGEKFNVIVPVSQLNRLNSISCPGCSLRRISQLTTKKRNT